MLVIDGSFGEGGGQIVRSSLALSAVTGQAFSMHNVRAGRDKPGLRQQHMTAVKSVAKICDAEVQGAEVGSSHLTFRPGKIRGGDYLFDIVTAGSTTLVLQAVLPALLLAEKPSTIELRGGTHNPFAPPFDFIEKAFLPLLDRMGPSVSAHIERYGFYPAGGGRLIVQVKPATCFKPFELLDRGKLRGQTVRAIVANLPRHIGDRECRQVRQSDDWNQAHSDVVEVQTSASPGNVVLLEVEFQNVTEVFVAFGSRGLPAEKVARSAVCESKEYLKSTAPVGKYLADQLILPLGISAHLGHGGGRFRTVPLSLHSKTHLELLEKFLEIETHVEETNDGHWLVHVGQKDVGESAGIKPA